MFLITDSAKLAANHGLTWSREEVIALIAIWNYEKTLEHLDNFTRKKHVFEKMAQRLDGRNGFVLSFGSIREKTKQLKQSYKKVKDKQ